MSVQWRTGLRAFAIMLALGLLVRAAVMLVSRGNLDGFVDTENLSILLMVAIFTGIGTVRQ